MAGNRGCSGHSDRNSWVLISWTWSRKYREQTESSVRLWNLKACPSDIVPPERLHVLNLPNSSLIKYQVFKHLSVWGERAFSLKPPQYSILNYWQYNCQLIKCGQYMDLETKQDKRTLQWGNLVDAVSTRQSRSTSTRTGDVSTADPEVGACKQCCAPVFLSQAKTLCLFLRKKQSKTY